MRISYKLTKQEEQIRNIEGDRPSLCFGFALPPNCQDFPQKPISLFMRLAQPKYNDEQLIPLSPTHSRQFGNAGTTVVHRFDLTNNTALAVNFRLLTSKGIRDNRLPISEEDWDAQPLIFISEENKLDLVLSIKTGETKQIEVRVSIPDHVKVNSSYRGFLQLERIDEDNLSRVYSATFETFVGTELPKLKQPQLSWQYWNGKDWAKLTVSDATENFTRPGVITFLPPKDFALRKDFGLLLRYWLRVRWESGDYLVEPRLKGVLLNTVMATQTVTISNEILGSSDGSENQKFRTTRIPVLKGQKLEVRETELPSAQEQKDIKRDEGDDAITFIPNTSGYSSKEYWVRWHEVPDFYASVARDRHYVINHLTGEIQFGDGRNGLIPPLAKSNIRMTYYQTGGGTTGNKPAGTIVQLKTTIPYVNRVTNYEPATGGTDAETPESLIERVPRQIRHHDRAVTLEDYEDIASLASAEVARVKCVPLRNLAVNPLDEKELPGAVSVIIMPYSTDAKPLPSLELISRVQNYLEAHADPTASINVVGPLYVRVNITAELALSSLEGAAAVEQSVEQKLASFLHPLTGGFDGTGWDFGREPYKSDFYWLLESVPGVDHVRYLKVEDIEDKVGAKGTKRFLVYSGKHDISPTFTQA
jgi:hypothetical protein